MPSAKPCPNLQLVARTRRYGDPGLGSQLPLSELSCKGLDTCVCFVCAQDCVIQACERIRPNWSASMRLCTWMRLAAHADWKSSTRNTFCQRPGNCASASTCLLFLLPSLASLNRLASSHPSICPTSISAGHHSPDLACSSLLFRICTGSYVAVSTSMMSELGWWLDVVLFITASLSQPIALCILRRCNSPTLPSSSSSSSTSEQRWDGVRRRGRIACNCVTHLLGCLAVVPRLVSERHLADPSLGLYSRLLLESLDSRPSGDRDVLVEAVHFHTR